MLEVLNVFKAYQIESPIKLQKKKRKRAIIIFASKWNFYHVFAHIRQFINVFALKFAKIYFFANHGTGNYLQLGVISTMLVN